MLTWQKTPTGFVSTDGAFRITRREDGSLMTNRPEVTWALEFGTTTLDYHSLRSAKATAVQAREDGMG